MARYIAGQLELYGLNETRRRVVAEGVTGRERERLLQRVDVTHTLMTELPGADDLSFLHSGLCQTCYKAGYGYIGADYDIEPLNETQRAVVRRTVPRDLWSYFDV